MIYIEREILQKNFNRKAIHKIVASNCVQKSFLKVKFEVLS